MQYLSPGEINWSMFRRIDQPTQASGPSTAQSLVAQTDAQASTQSTGGQTLEELLKLQQQQQQAQPTPLGQNYLRQFMTPVSTNYFQQLY